MKKEKNLIFGNDIKINNPCKAGNLYCFCYKNNYALLTVGPNFIYAIFLILICST